MQGTSVIIGTRYAWNIDYKGDQVCGIYYILYITYCILYTVQQVNLTHASEINFAAQFK